jgi:hypothetical protein
MFHLTGIIFYCSSRPTRFRKQSPIGLWSRKGVHREIHKKDKLIKLEFQKQQGQHI